MKYVISILHIGPLSLQEMQIGWSWPAFVKNWSSLRTGVDRLAAALATAAMIRMC